MGFSPEENQGARGDRAVLFDSVAPRGSGETVAQGFANEVVARNNGAEGKT